MQVHCFTFVKLYGAQKNWFEIFSDHFNILQFALSEATLEHMEIGERTLKN